ncbi:MAG: PAS domain S-box protein [Lachnospiraceae bacterium]|nr:PAS domain S-box protein [Lachnospiraceae bacterium]
MEQKNDTRLMQKHIMRDMSEGMLIVDFSGTIRAVNPAALAIFGCAEEDLVGLPFAACFFEYPENDEFNQTILDAVYSSGERQERIVPFKRADRTLTLHVRASFLKEEGRRLGLIAVISDISELAELRDAVKAMEKIQTLNRKLELKNEFLEKTFGRYISDDVVRTILETPDGLVMGGRKREVTVMISDLRDFTALSTRMDPAPFLEMLNHYFEEVYEVIESYHGTLLEFLGDGLFVVFGAPIASSDHAAEAAAAAVSMQLRMERVNAWNREHGFEELRMGIGLSTGEVIAGNIGSEKRTKYGVMGQVVNLAGRLESYTAGGDIIISQATRDAVKEPLELAASRRIHFKGLTEELTVYRLLGIGGRHGLHLPEDSRIFRSLDRPMVLSMSPMEGKTVLPERYEVRLTEVSLREAWAETDAPLQNFDSLYLDWEEGVYARVAETQGERYRLRFTSCPPSFAARLRLAFSG